MSASYDNKPAFIEPLIQAGSTSFMSGFCLLLEAAALVESAPSRAALGSDAQSLLDKAAWHLANSESTYSRLGVSLKSLTPSARIKQMSAAIDFAQAIDQAVASGMLMENKAAKARVIDVIRGGEPSVVVDDFKAMLVECHDSTKAIVLSSDALVDQVHTALTKCMSTLVFGQYVAYVNKVTRAKVAA